jgi:dTDP-4-amino-4,6-dideoxygalactose transaminase
MAAILADIRPGDEVVMPSYTFVSTANAFALRGARIAFVDIRPDTMNMDESLLEAAITPQTRVLVPVHYAGVACEMNAIMSIAERYGLFVAEDAAQALLSDYEGRPLGTIGELGCFSFHETKNIQCGEGGALAVNRAELVARAEIVREKGTNRSRFFRGEVDKYSWVELGSSYLMSDLNAAYLFAQLEAAEEIVADRTRVWNRYRRELDDLAARERLELPSIPPGCGHNAHLFYVKTRDLRERTELIAYLRERGVYAVFHYVPLHGSEAGRRLGRFVGEDRYTSRESERLLRLPLYYRMDERDATKVIEAIHSFYRA